MLWWCCGGFPSPTAPPQQAAGQATTPARPCLTGRGSVVRGIRYTRAMQRSTVMHILKIGRLYIDVEKITYVEQHPIGLYVFFVGGGELRIQDGTGTATLLAWLDRQATAFDVPPGAP
jgi:hypothetical protein